MLQDDVKASIIAQAKDKFSISYIKLWNLAVKSDKYDPKVVVLPKRGQRFMVFSNKNPSKLENSIHYLEIKSFESKSSKELKITYGETKALQLSSAGDESEVDEMLIDVGVQLKAVFPLLPMENLIATVELLPTDRMGALWKKLDAVVVNDLSPCAGFSRMYICMCDLYGSTLVEEIIWDLDTIYLSQDSKTLYLRDFDHLSLRDHVPLLAALQYNEWFTGVDAANMKMTGEALAEVLKVVRRNTSIADWNLCATGIKVDFMQKFSTCLSSNTMSKISSLTLSGNAIEDKGISYLSEAIAGLVHGVQSLTLSQCSITLKGVNKLMEGIALNKCMMNTLHTLNLSGNPLRGDEPQPLYKFLSQSNVLQKLNLADTEIPLDSLITALLHGSVRDLEELNVSGNPYSSKKSKDTKISGTWKQFFCSVLVLSKLNMSNTKLPAPAIKEMLLGLSANTNTPSVYVDLSNNDMKSEGGAVLGSCVANLANVSGLDLSDNGLDLNLYEILPWFGKNGAIRHLSIGKNFSQLRNKALQQALDALVSAIQDEHCVLESLSIADSKLRLDTTVVINALGSTISLKSLDISGNIMGDIGAKMLAKALTINSTLTNVVWDKNNITSSGLRDIAQSLQRNYTLLDMPLPIFDIAACARINPQLIHTASMEIQTCLQRNHAPRRMTYGQCYRLQQGFLVSSAQSIIDKHVHKIHTLLNSLCESDNLSPDEFNEAKKLLSDADKSKQLLMLLQTVAIKCEEAPNVFTDSVKDVSSMLGTSVSSQLEKTQQEMFKMIGTECVTALSDKDARSSLEAGARSRGLLSQSEISSLVDKHLVSDIQSKISSRNFDVAVYIAESVIDSIVDLLHVKYNELKAKKTQSTITVDTMAEEDIPFRGTISPGGMAHLGDDMPGNRLSVMNTLRRRPQSVIDHSRDMKANPNIQEHDEADDSGSSKHSGTTTPNASAEPEILQLPNTGAAPALKHLNKERPKRAKNQAGRRPVPAVASLESTDAETVDDFFKPAAAVSQTPVLVTAPTATPRKGSKIETSGKSEKLDDSPKMKQKSRSPFGGAAKDKQEADKKKGGMIASGISNFFKKKKPEKTVDQPDGKSAEGTPVAPSRPDRASDRSSSQSNSTPAPKSRTGSGDIPGPDRPATPKKSGGKSDTADLKAAPEEEQPSSNIAAKSSSLERNAADPMSKSTLSAVSEDADDQSTQLIAPKRKPVGIGLPGMSSGLLAEMQSKRPNTQSAAPQPKAAPRGSSQKVEETGSPPVRPSPPSVKPTSPVGELKRADTAPPVRPSPPKPTAAPREPVAPSSTTTTAAPASVSAAAPAPSKPPVLRPKPPKLMPKPKPTTRPVTMMDISAHSSGSAKTAPPKPPPPNMSKRQTYVSPNLASPISPQSPPPILPPKKSVAAKSNQNSGVTIDKLKTPSADETNVSKLEPVQNRPSDIVGNGAREEVAEPLSSPGNAVDGDDVKDSQSDKQMDTIEDKAPLKSSVSQGDLLEAVETRTEASSNNRSMISSTSSRDSTTEETTVTVRNSRPSSAVRLSNGSLSKRVSTPTPQTAHVEEGPVLQPPPPKAEKRQPPEQMPRQEKDSPDADEPGEESMV